MIKKCYICNDSRLLFRDHDGYEFYQCVHCRIIHFYGIGKKEIEEFYNNNYFTSSSSIKGYKAYRWQEKIHRKNAVDILNKIEEYESSTYLFDVGCAYGFLLDEGRNRGWKVSGIDISKDAVNFASNILNLPVSHCNTDSIDFAPNNHDVITIIGAIEHFINPKEVLIKTYHSLTDNGIVVITTFNLEGKFHWYHLKPPEHLFYFSAWNLTNLLFQCGFTVKEIKTYWCWYELSDVIGKVGIMIGWKWIYKIGEFIHGTWFDLAIKIPNNEMMVIAQKETHPKIYKGKYPVWCNGL